jgi:hypothetical protein
VTALYRTTPAASRLQGGSLFVSLPPPQGWLRLSSLQRQVWSALEYPIDMEALVSRLSDGEPAPERMAPDIRQALGVLAVHGLVEVEAGPAPADVRHRDRYLWLLKRALINLIYVEHDLRLQFLQREGRALEGLALSRALRDIRTRDLAAYSAFVDGKLQGAEPRRHSHTMVGLFRLNNLERCAETLFRDGVPGDFLEAGVCQGGASIFLRALQVAHGQAHRQTWLADSFQGVAPSVSEVDRRYGVELDEPRAPWLAADLETVREHFRRYDLLGEAVRFLPGWLADTLPAAPIGPLALLRLDVDLYSATTTALDQLYERVSPGGFVVADDYGELECCRDAVDDFRRRAGVSEPLLWADANSVYWRKAG